MPRQKSDTPNLTTAALRNAKPREKPYKISAGGSLYALVTPNGAVLWRYKFTHAGKAKQLALGAFPDVGIAKARELRDDARKKLRAGIDPCAERKAEKSARREAAENTFGGVAKEWLAACRSDWYPATTERVERFLSQASALNSRPIADVTPAEVLALVKRIAADGRAATAQRVLRTIGCVMRYAVQHGISGGDVTRDLRGAIKPGKVTKRAALTKPAEVGGMLRAIDTYNGQPQTRAALLMLAHTLVRSKELRGAEWSEFDFDAKTWTIPAERMKGRKRTKDELAHRHIVPLSEQVIAILTELKAITGKRNYVFANTRDPRRFMSENTLVGALRIMGFPQGVATAHGFRRTGSALLNELKWRPDVIECALAHAIPGVRGIYAATTFLDERRQMMQAWSDHLDNLRDTDGKNVVPMRREESAAA